MNPVRREPAVAVGLVTAFLGVLLVYGVLDEKQAAAWGAFLFALIPVVQGVVTRFFVMPVAVVKEAGYDPACVNERADDPNVKPFQKPKR